MPTAATRAQFVKFASVAATLGVFGGACSQAMPHAANDERDEEWLRNMYEIGGDVFTYYHDHDFPMNPASGMPGNYDTTAPPSPACV